MKSVEEMTDVELAEAFETFDLKITDDYDESYSAMREELIARLAAHPAQRIADLTGGVVTKNKNGVWKLWPNDDLITAYGSWSANFVKVEHFILSLLPDDNRPWQESIYKPQVNVKNGGKDG